MKRIVYFDSGTTNTRGYLLDENFHILAEARRAVGSKDSAVAGSNRVLIDGLFEVYGELLCQGGLTDGEVAALYASGMVTCAYGLREVDHLPLPVTVRDFAGRLFPFEEQTRFQRAVNLIPGLKTVDPDIARVNNMRGEEIELLGVMPALRARCGDEPVAVVMPGSHTHTALVRGDRIEDILSAFTGELFAAVAKDTILAPVLQYRTDELDGDMAREGVRNLKRYGFSRALYICRAMDIFHRGDARARLSYGEGVLLGGVCQGLDYNLENLWTDCHTAVVLADGMVGQLYRTLLGECPRLTDVSVFSPEPGRVNAVEGLKHLLSA